MGLGGRISVWFEILTSDYVIAEFGLLMLVRLFGSCRRFVFGLGFDWFGVAGYCRLRAASAWDFGLLWFGVV